MPQEFQILRCCDCEKFQVHHVKKAKKWQCKVCGVKQSLKRAFFIGSAQDCRINVQKLNLQVGEQEMKKVLDQNYNSYDMHNENSSLELINEGIDFPTENDWVDENDWIDEEDVFEENPSCSYNLYDENSKDNIEEELPRKKQRCEIYSEDTNFNHLSEDLEDKEYLFSSAFKCEEDKSSSEVVESITDISNIQVVVKMDSKQECDSIKDREENSLSRSAKFKTNSILKPTQGFQLILNEAKRQKSSLNYNLDI